MARARQQVRTRRATRQRARDALAHLTDAQRAAVTHRGGPLLVLAGAGTGKTRVLVERIAWLAREQAVPVLAILALSFTEKAAAELQERVDAALPISAFSPWIGTFHGFCESVLREEAIRIGLDPRFRILSAPEAWLLVKRNLFALPLARYRPLGNPMKFVTALVDFFAAAKDQGVTPEMLEQHASRQGNSVGPLPAALGAEWRELAATYRAYVELQRREGVFDFGDLVLETLRLFRERPDVRARYRARYPYVLVDEFQDTNATQGALLEALAGPDGNLLVASDDDQAIYAFRGSNIENVLTFRERFRNTAIAVLTENFRSPQPLLDHAYQLIQHNNPYRLEATAGVSKQLVSRITESGNRQPAAGAEHRHLPTEEEEFAWVANEILQLVDAGAAYRDIAILLRMNAQAADVAPSLIRRDIPHVTAEARGLLARPEVKDALAYFRLFVDPRDARALFRLLAHQALTVAENDRAEILAELRARRGVALSLLTDATVRARLTSASRAGIERLAALLTRHLRTFRTLQPSTVYLEFLEQSGVLKAAVAASEKHPEVLPNLQAFLAYIRALERGLSPGDFLEFFDILDAAVEGGEGPPAATLPADTDAVRVLTVHAAKGLEFPYVFVVGATADRYPAKARHRTLELPADLLRGSVLGGLEDRATHVLEERRLFYVALTRAQRRLVLTSSTTAPGARLRRKPSPFIAEAGIPSQVLPAGPGGPREQLALPLLEAPSPAAAADAAQSLSASKIAEYELCPLKYRFHYVLRVPIPPQHTFSFGTTLHDVLRDLAREVSASRRPTVDDALRLYEQQWVSEGYESAEHEAARKAAGRAALQTFLRARPELLTRAPLAVEASFTLPLGSTRLTGRIDRIDRLDDGRVLVTDFKTGEGKMKNAETDTQLSLYALALRRAFRLEPAALQLSYIETGRDDAATRTAEQDAATARHVEALAGEIRAGAFPARPGFHCRFCDFRHICDYAQLP